MTESRLETRRNFRIPRWVLKLGLGLLLIGGLREASAHDPAVCERTLEVSVAIVAASGVATCGDVEEFHLREITHLDFGARNLDTLSLGDFDGLIRLQTLDLSHNLLESLPEGLFDGLFLLEALYLDNNSLETVPENLFEPLFLLRELTLHGNPVLELPAGLFDEFSRFDGMAANGDPADNSGSYPRIGRFLDRHGVTSPEEFIAALPDLHKQRFSFVYESEAAEREHVSYEYPRFVSWGADGRFIFAWNTDPDAPSRFRDAVEFLRQDETDWRAGVIDFSGEDPEITEPADCRTCHGSLNKPLWGAAFSWAGTEYAAIEDPDFEDARNAMQTVLDSTHPRIEPLDFSASAFPLQIEAENLTERYLRLPERSAGLLAVEEAGLLFSLRHAEVLFRRLKARDDYREIAEDALCAPDSWSAGELALGPFSESEHDPAILATTQAPIQSVHGRSGFARMPDDGYGAGGELGNALIFLMLADLWEQEPILRKLYREVSSRDTLASETQWISDAALDYGAGGATAEDELIRQVRLRFGQANRASLLERAIRNARMPRHGDLGASFFDGHLDVMRPQVCQTLRDSPPRNAVVEWKGGRAMLRWDAPRDPDSLTGYRILRGADGDSVNVLVEDTGGVETSYEDRDLVAGNDYVYSVRALYGPYASPESNRTRLEDVPETVAPQVTGPISFTVMLADRNEASTVYAGPDRAGVEGGATATLSGSRTGADPGETLTQVSSKTDGKAAAAAQRGQSPGAVSAAASAGDPAVRAASGDATLQYLRSAGICDRTPEVRDAIAESLGAACGDIDLGDLKEIVTLDLSGQSLARLAAGDFDGLERLRLLDLSDNALVGLPPGVFDGLLTVETLRLHDNRLVALAAGVFDKLLTLEELTLHGNLLAALPDTPGMFEDFSPFHGLSLTDPPGPAPGGIEVLEGYLDRHSVESVEEFIEALPPAHKKNFVMVYESQGLGAEFVSQEHPRMISWGADGKYQFAWQTNPEADEPFKSGVEFLIAEGAEWLAGVVDFSGETPEIARPESCASCHGSLNKPLWATGVLDEDTRAGEGTEEDARWNRGAWRSTRSLMESDAPRIAPMDFESSSLKQRDSRRLRPFATVQDEFAAAVARQHAEVLFQDLRGRSDREAVFRDLLCDYEGLYGGEAALGIFGNDPLPSFVEATESHLEFVYPKPSFFYFHFGSLLHALNFRVQHHYWREREDVRALFAGRSNTGMDGVENVYLIFNKYPDLRFYAPGTATMEEELIRAFRHTFGHRAALHVENGETAHRVRREKMGFRPGHHHDYSFPAYRNVNHEMQRRVCAYLKSNRLGGLTLSGIPIGDFRSDRTRYSTSVGSEVTSTTVRLTTAAHDATVTIRDPNGSTTGRERTVSLSEGANTITITVTAGDGSARTYTVIAHVAGGTDYDRDDDGLIEVSSLAQLDAIRHDLDGDGRPDADGADAFTAAFPDAAAQMGCGSGCQGYELTADLDFDTNGNGAADAGDAYWNGGAGWRPIGRGRSALPSFAGGYQATFEGNGHRISNLFIDSRDALRAGLFGLANATIRHVGMVNADVTGTGAAAALAAALNGTVSGSYATGSVSGAMAGGLVGITQGARVRANFSTARVAGRVAGGLVGYSNIVEAGYATGSVTGDDADGRAGGLVARQRGGSSRVVNSYARGAVSGAGRVAGLEGGRGEVVASHWDSDTSGLAGGRSTAALQSPTDYGGIYRDWNADLDGDGDPDDFWDFGTSEEYPVLSVDFDGDGEATWQEFGYQLRSGPTLTATPGAGQVTLAWTAVDVSHWSPPPAVRYAVTRDDGDNRRTIVENLEVPGYADVDAEPGTVYTYQVVAVVDGGEGARSAWVEAEADPAPEQPMLSIFPDAEAATEGSAVPFRVMRAGSTADALVVDLSVSESGAMVSDPPESVTLEAGARQGTVTVPTSDDSVVESESTVIVTLASGSGYEVGDPSLAAATVADNDAAGFTVTASPEEIAEGDSATVTVSVSDGMAFADEQRIPLTVSGTAEKDVDYTLSSTELTLPAGAHSATATVAALADEVVENAETVVVAASHDGEAVAFATVTIAAGKIGKDDATLRSLALSGADIGTFASGTTAYTATVNHDLAATTVTAAPTSTKASLVIAPADADTVTDDHQVNLAVGDTKITVTVTAEDKTTTQTYTVTVTRAPAAPAVTGTTAFTVTEGETAVGTLTATDQDTAAEDLKWSVTGGADAGKFGVTKAGVLTFASAKDFEAPDDTGTDGTYEVTVQVSDGTNQDTAEVTVTLANRNEAPTADAGADQAGIEGGATVTLSGTGSDPDADETLAYAWTQTAGTTVTLSAPAAAGTTFTAPSDLTANEGLTFRLTVTDGRGLTAEDEVTVTVAAPGAAPVVTGTTAFTVTEGETAVGTLTATDEDTAAEDLEWSITGGADAGKFGLTAAGVLTFAAGKDYEDPDDTGTDGTYDVTVQVSDGTNTATAAVTVALANRNEAPTADAGADQAGIEGGATVTLSGTGSDPDANDTLTYAWTQTAGTTVTLSAPAAAGTTFTAPSDLAADEGLTFRLTVTDGGGLTAEDDVRVEVLGAPAPVLTGFALVDVSTQAVVAALVDGAEVDLGEGRGGDFGIRADVAEGATIGSVTLALSGAKTVARTENLAPYSLYGDRNDAEHGRALNGASLPAGSYGLTAIAYAERGGSGTKLGSLSVSFRVLDPPAPQITGTTAFTVTEGDTAVGTLAATDEDTASEDLDWSITGGADRGRFTLSSAGVLAFRAAKDYEDPDDIGQDGTYAVTVQVSDGTGSDTANVTVTLANRNEAPTADAGADQTGIEGGTTVTLSGTGSDPDANDTLTYAWTQTAGTTVTLSAPAAAGATFTAPSDLTADTGLTFRLTVTDGGGLTAVDDVQVTVLAAPPPDPDATREGAVRLNAEAAAQNILWRNYRLDTAAGDRVDYFVFTLTERKTLGLGVRYQTFDLDASLEDSEGETLMESWPPPVDPTVEWLKITLDSGTYYIRVEAVEEGSTRYLLRFGLDDPPPEDP